MYYTIHYRIADEVSQVDKVDTLDEVRALFSKALAYKWITSAKVFEHTNDRDYLGRKIYEK